MAESNLSKRIVIKVLIEDISMIPSLPEIIDFLDENYVENYEGMPDMEAASSVDDDHYIFIKFKSNEEAKDAIPKLTGKKVSSQSKEVP